MTAPAAPIAVEMRGITKRFGSLIANDNLSLTLHAGQIHALLGENGAGKSTLSKILYGLYQPDAGSINVYGTAMRLQSPKDAIKAGIGMVTQHFSLVSRFTVAENISLGTSSGLRQDRAAVARRVAQTAERFGLSIDPNVVVGKLAVGEQQRVEILKALYRDCRVLILDEPTAVLTPQESGTLFAGLKRLVAAGLSIVFISHKLDEIVAHCDAVTVLRNGKLAYSGPLAQTTAAQLARHMVGRDLNPPARDVAHPGDPVLSVTDLTLRDQRGVTLLDALNLTLRRGEILGVAGVAGNGQREFSEVLSGLRNPTTGRVLLNGADITHATPSRRVQAGMGRIPEDRLSGVVGDMSVAYNLALERLDEYTVNGIVDQKRIFADAERHIRDYQIKATPADHVRRLSGGNIQKIILARVLSRDPSCILAAQPARGLDVGATDYIHDRLRDARRAQAAVLLISEDLDELLKLADRIVVMSGGRIIGEVAAAEATTEQLGLMMGGMRVAHG
jgi:simple sugar transport system ATP-binding protein